MCFRHFSLNKNTIFPDFPWTKIMSFPNIPCQIMSFSLTVPDKKQTIFHNFSLNKTTIFPDFPWERAQSSPNFARKKYHHWLSLNKNIKNHNFPWLSWTKKYNIYWTKNKKKIPWLSLNKFLFPESPSWHEPRTDTLQ